MRGVLSISPVLSLALASAPSLASQVDPPPELQAVEDAAVAILAYRDSHGRPTARPITPYRDGGTIVITSTLAFMRKTVHIRRDGRVALLSGGYHVLGDGAVHADLTGDEFVARLLDQELDKYPPAHDILSVPFHRRLFSWYFGRVYVEFEPQRAQSRPGADRCTLITLDTAGYPRITPIAEPGWEQDAFAIDDLDVADGLAAILIHEERDEMRDLRQVIVRGELRSGEFHVRSRGGSLAPPTTGWWDAMGEHLGYHRRAREARRIIRSWQGSSAEGEGR